MTNLSDNFYEIRDSEIQGKGVFVTREIRKDEHLFHVDLRNIPSYTVEEIANNPILAENGDHSDYVGEGKYVVDLSPPSHINHSCSPNCYVVMKSIPVKDVYALRDIKEGEELTVDYALTSVDQFGGEGFWKTDCNCGSENCRGTIEGDFFLLPIELQRKFYKNLPPSILDKFKDRFTKLR